MSELIHYGVPGMRWGVRKSSKAALGPESVEVKKTPGKLVKTSGGRRHMPSQDAEVARTFQQKAKKSSVDSLSNQELQALVTRMNLEQQYHRLAKTETHRMNKGFVAIKKLLVNPALRDLGVAKISESNPNAALVAKVLSSATAQKKK